MSSSIVKLNSRFKKKSLSCPKGSESQAIRGTKTRREGVVGSDENRNIRNIINRTVTGLDIVRVVAIRKPIEHGIIGKDAAC